MKICLIFCLFSLIFGASCPGMCSNHGTCSKSGTCICYEGYTFGDCSGKVCPYGKTYVEPSADIDNAKDKHTDLECSGKGNCNRESGLCECFNGFEGNACQRLSCPNSCSGHGLCVPVRHLSLDSNSGYKSIYDNIDNDKVRWDKDQSYACVCDGEYEGFDCSEKKCPKGYSATSDCESSSEESTITVTIPTTNKLLTDELVYLEYTDMYGRKWYSDKFDPTIVSDSGSDHGWDYALKRLPVGVIDYNGVTPSKTPTLGDGDSVTITFGNQQTGRQSGIKIITYKDIENDKTANNLYPGANTPSGYHGMSIDDLKMKYDKTDISSLYNSATTVGSAFTITSSGIPPTVCSGNGSCDTETGLCQCFDGFYGNACSMTESSM